MVYLNANKIMIPNIRNTIFKLSKTNCFRRQVKISVRGEKKNLSGVHISGADCVYRCTVLVYL